MPKFALLPAEKAAAMHRGLPDYGSPEFTERIAGKFHEGRRKAIAQARKAGLL